jgi:serine/threonine protein kinase
LFCGNGDIDQLYKIFEIMGLPNEQDWPSQSMIPRASFTTSRNGEYKPVAIENIIKNIDELGKNMLLRLLDFNLFNRMTARDALLHDYFKPGSEKVNEEQEQEQLAEESCGAQAPPLSNQIQKPTLPDITNIFQPNILKRKRPSQPTQEQQNE